MTRLAVVIAFSVSILATSTHASALRSEPRGGSAPRQTPASGPRRAELHEDSLRKTATSKPSPVYPASALAKKLRGLVVAQIETNAEGRVIRVDILESAAPEFSEAVNAAVRQWSWPPLTLKGKPDRLNMIGRLTFYFEIVDGKGVVKNPGNLQKPVPGKPVFPKQSR